ncbi:GPI-anchored surface protein, putative [Bodo saltans]|uniref:GPI-anchored surface protein, putative n=1 Tax=Bodo saltans TaxID=75058 RepID=A0A0S4IH87_BODSA|nr:GPI-anchored surface protein, putative [Bodo saltans]|eukprot:CUE62000.1 GPI-anchored surface protein, putative [Bodo saltans]
MAEALAQVARDQRRQNSKQSSTRDITRKQQHNEAAATFVCVHPSYVVAQVPRNDDSTNGTTTFSSRLTARGGDAKQQVNELTSVLSALLLHGSHANKARSREEGEGGSYDTDGEKASRGVALSIVACSSSTSGTNVSQTSSSPSRDSVVRSALSTAVGVVRDFLLHHGTTPTSASHIIDNNRASAAAAGTLGSFPLRVAAALAYAEDGLTLVSRLTTSSFVGCSLNVTPFHLLGDTTGHNNNMERHDDDDDPRRYHSIHGSSTVAAASLPPQQHQSHQSLMLSIRASYSPILVAADHKLHHHNDHDNAEIGGVMMAGSCLEELVNMPLSMLSDLLCVRAVGTRHYHSLDGGEHSNDGNGELLFYQQRRQEQCRVLTEVASNVLRELQQRQQQRRSCASSATTTPSNSSRAAVCWDTFLRRLEPIGRSIVVAADDSSASFDERSGSATAAAATMSGCSSGTRAILRAMFVMLLTQQLRFELSGRAKGSDSAASLSSSTLLIPASQFAADVCIVVAALTRGRSDVLSDTFFFEVLRMLPHQEEEREHGANDDERRGRGGRGDGGGGSAAFESSLSLSRLLLTTFGDDALRRKNDDNYATSSLLSSSYCPASTATFSTLGNEDEEMERQAIEVLSRVLCTSPYEESSSSLPQHHQQQQHISGGVFGGGAPVPPKRRFRAPTCALEGLMLLVTEVVIETTNRVVAEIMKTVGGGGGGTQQHETTLPHHHRTRRFQDQHYESTQRRRLSVVVTCCDGSSGEAQLAAATSAAAASAQLPVVANEPQQKQQQLQQRRGVFSQALRGEGAQHLFQPHDDVHNNTNASVMQQQQLQLLSTLPTAVSVLGNVAADMATTFALRTLRDELVSSSTHQQHSLLPPPSFSLQLLQDSFGSSDQSIATASSSSSSSVLPLLADLAAQLHHEQHLPPEVSGGASQDVHVRAAALLTARHLSRNSDDAVKSIALISNELFVRLPHIWSATSPRDQSPQHQQEMLWYNITAGVPLCPMPLTVVGQSLLQLSTSPYGTDERSLVGKNLLGGAAASSSHSLLDALDPNMRAAMMSRLMAADAGGGAGMHDQRQQNSTSLLQQHQHHHHPHPAVQRYREQLLQSRVLFKRRMDACHRFTMDRVQSLFSSVVRDDAVTHLYMCCGAPSSTSTTSTLSPDSEDINAVSSKYTVDSDDNERQIIEAGLVWCLGPYLLQQTHPHYNQSQQQQDHQERQRGPQQFIDSMPAEMFCEEFFPVVANAPNIARLRAQRTSQQLDEDVEDDQLLLREMCRALSFPPGSIAVDVAPHPDDGSEQGDRRATTTSKSKGGRQQQQQPQKKQLLLLLVTAVGAQHLQSLRHSVDAIVQSSQQQQHEPNDIGAAQHLLHDHGAQTGATSAKTIKRNTAKPLNTTAAAANVSGHHKDPLSLHFTPHKHYVDSGTVRYLSQTGDADDLLGFRYHESQIAAAAAEAESARLRALEAAQKDVQQPPWRRALLVPLEEQVHLTQRAKRLVTQSKVSTTLQQQQHQQDKQQQQQERSQIPASAHHHHPRANTSDSLDPNASQRTERNRVEPAHAPTIAVVAAVKTPASRRHSPSASRPPPPQPSSLQTHQNTHTKRMVGHVAADVSFATISSIQSSSTSRHHNSTKSVVHVNVVPAGSFSTPSKTPRMRSGATLQPQHRQSTASFSPSPTRQHQTSSTPTGSAASRERRGGGGGGGAFNVNEFLSMVRAAQ